MVPAVRERLGKYQLVTLMSVGGMAELYLASTPGPGGFQKVVALKQVLPEFRDDPVFVERFLDEARLTALLTHPNIGQVFDLGESDGEIYLAMEFIAGVDLSRLQLAADHSKRLPPGFVARVARDIALGLASAHELVDPESGEITGVIHRDVTPRNVMLTFDGVVKVVDFGLARFRGRRVKTEVGMVRGTPQYMAPEQLRDEHLDGRTDLFGLGVLMWEFLAGRYLTEGGLDEVVARLRRNEQAPPVLEFAPDTPPALADIVSTCLRNDIEQRFGSARELSRALERCGVPLFDEGELAAVAARRLPETKRSLKRLIGLATRPETDVPALKAELKRLRTADKPGAQSIIISDDIDTNPAPRPARVSSEPPPDPHRANRPPKVVIAAAALVVLAGLGLWAKGVVVSEPEPVVKKDERSEDAKWRARTALNKGELFQARALLDGCVSQRGPCIGLESLRGEIDDALAKSSCGTDDAARRFIAESMEMTTDAAVTHLYGCTAGKQLHPMAASAIQRRTLVK